MPASRPYMKSRFGPFDTRIKIGRRVMEAKSVSLQPKWAALEKVAVKNNNKGSPCLANSIFIFWNKRAGPRSF